MKRKKQGTVDLERLNNSISKDNLPSEELRNLIIEDINRVLNSYLVYQKEDISYRFYDNSGVQELNITLKYRHFKDINML